MREDHDFRKSTRAKLYKSQNGICGYCKKVIKGKPSLDHIIPLNAMEENDCHEENYIVTCIPCNKRKGDRIVFSNLIDHEIYPMIDTPYFFRASDIQYNKKDKRLTPQEGTRPMPSENNDSNLSPLDCGLDADIEEYIQTAAFQFYNQRWFAQYKMQGDGTIEFTPNGSEFIPYAEFSNSI